MTIAFRLYHVLKLEYRRMLNSAAATGMFGRT